MFIGLRGVYTFETQFILEPISIALSVALRASASGTAPPASA
jgi:hypothetical protein